MGCVIEFKRCAEGALRDISEGSRVRILGIRELGVNPGCGGRLGVLGAV